eukprot:CAMPEP_0177723642 /NCGR_PEP_ID=MMETSP0484_2-20121128/18316_1 /TAXON_ID=354590 /ORGANISM="Rhodomonas lens, Strain RHODO" /LENGTH=225 /DNA_ID=CAMNT_0019236081 /DNA_START=94 /DNA_END=770 /DNA_ORIENTATION=-
MTGIHDDNRVINVNGVTVVIIRARGMMRRGEPLRTPRSRPEPHWAAAREHEQVYAEGGGIKGFRVSPTPKCDSEREGPIRRQRADTGSVEVVWCGPGGVRLSFPRSAVELQEGAAEVFVDLHDARQVAAPVAVVRGREDGEDLLLVRPAVHHHLVCSGHELDAVILVELLRNVRAKRPPGAARRRAPPRGVFRGVAPEEVADGSFVGHLDVALEGADVVERIKRG